MFGANRPVRQRKTVAHYSDDNPNTFTVKTKKGKAAAADNSSSRNDHGKMQAQQQKTDQLARPQSSTTAAPQKAAASTGTPKKRGRPPKPKPAQELLTKQRQRSSGSTGSAASASAASSVVSFFPTRGGGGGTKRNHNSNSSRSSSSNHTKKKKQPPLAAAAAFAAAPTKTPSPTELSSPTKQLHSASSLPTTTTPRKRKMRPVESSDHPTSADAAADQDTILAHAATVQPILPWNLLCSSSSSSSVPRTAAAAACRALGPAPVWRPWRDDVSSGGGLDNAAASSASAAATTTTPLPPHLAAPEAQLTWFQLRQDDPRYAVTGNVRGVVALYDLSSARGSPIQTISVTQAAVRENQRVVTSRTYIHYPNAVLQCAWCRHVVVLLTENELEARSASAPHQLLWTFPVDVVDEDDDSSGGGGSSAAPQQTSRLQIRCTAAVDGGDNSARLMRYHLLWTTGGRHFVQDDEDETSTDMAHSLWKLDFEVPDYAVDWDRQSSLITSSSSNLAPADDAAAASTTTTVSVQKTRIQPTELFQCWTTSWEAAATTTTTCLVIAQTAPERVELMRCACNSSDDGSTSSTTVLHRQELPVVRTTPVQECGIRPYPQHTFVTGAARGIRMYLTENLVWLATFGEAVQLHGKTVVWNRCVWVKAPTSTATTTTSVMTKTNKEGGGGSLLRRVTDSSSGGGGGSNSSSGSSGSSKKKPALWLERSDELAARYSSDLHAAQQKDNDEDEYWLVGVPHPFKGPAELQSTLYIWKPGAALDDTVTLQGPVSGCIGDFYISPDNGWRMVGVAAATGQLYEWRPTFRTDFAGIMYPVGYKVVQDNLEYIEDEDELDQAVIAVDEDDEEDLKTERSLPSLKAAASFEEEPVDPELAEALRLSLLEHQKQKMKETSEKKEVELSVLAKNDDDDDFVVPCWPEIDEAGDSISAPNSPQRVHALAHAAAAADGENAFEHVFLAALPETLSVRNEIQTLAAKRAAQEEADAAAAAAEKPKIKAKRTRTANIEVLLHASVDPELQQCMDENRGKWGDGHGSVLPKYTAAPKQEQQQQPSSSRKPKLEVSIPEPPPLPRDAHKSAIVRAHSAEEKALAMELLLLSPSNSQDGSQEGSLHGSTKSSSAVDAVAPAAPEVPGSATSAENKAQSAPPPPKLAPSFAAKDSIVTPSDTSPEGAAAAPKNGDDGVEEETEVPLPGICAACHGRMVVHSCGKREMPIDYEAIARAEQERKEREAAEKHRIRSEKRRVAEAKRREARRLKKLEEEEQQRLEEEQRQRELEAQRYEEPQAAYSANTSWAQPQEAYRPQFASPHAQLPPTGESPIPEYQQQRTNAYGIEEKYGSDQQQQQQYEEPRVQAQNRDRVFFSESSRRDSYASSSHSWNGTVQRTTPSSVNIDGTEVQTSASLHPTDALAALAGLADSLSQPVPVKDSQGASTPHGGWSSNGFSHQQQQNPESAGHYKYHGSDQRRADIISHAFSTAESQESATQPQQSNSVTNRYAGASTAVYSTTEANATTTLGEQKPHAYAYDRTDVDTGITHAPAGGSETASYAVTSHTDYRAGTEALAAALVPVPLETNQSVETAQPLSTGQAFSVQPVATTESVAGAVETISAHPLSQPRMPAAVQPVLNEQDGVVASSVQQSSIAVEVTGESAQSNNDSSGQLSLLTVAAASRPILTGPSHPAVEGDIEEQQQQQQPVSAPGPNAESQP